MRSHYCDQPACAICIDYLDEMWDLADLEMKTVALEGEIDEDEMAEAFRIAVRANASHGAERGEGLLMGSGEVERPADHDGPGVGDLRQLPQVDGEVGPCTCPVCSLDPGEAIADLLRSPRLLVEDADGPADVRALLEDPEAAVPPCVRAAARHV